MPEPKPHPSPSPFWKRDRHADRRPFLMARNRVVSAIRGWFEAQGFVEVDPPALQVSPGNEAHLHAFRADWLSPAGEPRPRYLHTSPEFAMKKLLAAGEERIFALSHVFRNREAGDLHAPEFTMLEWYRAGAPYEAIMADTLALVRTAAGAVRAETLRFRGRSAAIGGEAERLPVAEAFRRHAGIDLATMLGDRDGLARAAEAARIRIAADDGWSDIFSRILSEKVEPALGIGAMTLLTEYPAAEAALARPKPGDARFAERFELYAAGVELANGFGELTEPEEQRRRFVAEMDEKMRVYGEAYPLDEDFLAALAEMPAASGVALGLDRLVMLLTGAPRIDLVQWVPVDTESS